LIKSESRHIVTKVFVYMLNTFCSFGCSNSQKNPEIMSHDFYRYIKQHNSF